MDSTIAFCLKWLNNQTMVMYSLKAQTQSKWFFLIPLVCFVAIMFVFFSNPISNNPTRFEIIDVSISNSNDDSLDILSRFQLSFSSKVYDAINHGVPINIVLKYAQPKQQLWWKTYNPISRTTFRISRHALSNNYQLKNLSAFETHQFITIDEALKHIAIFQLKNLNTSSADKVALRIYLDIFNLPAQIRASAFFSSHWQHDSFWTTWDVSS